MIEIIIFFLTMLCTNPKPHEPGINCNGFHIEILDNEGGGDTGNPPPPPPPPTPPRS